MVDQSSSSAAPTAASAAGAGSEFARAWPVVLASAVGFGLGLSGLPFYTAGVFLDPLMSEFGWGVGQVQAGVTVMLLTSLVAGPIVGALADRFGARPVVLVSITGFALGFMSLSRVGADHDRFLLAWGVMALFGAGTMSVTWSRAIATWFERGRGMALGLALAGSGVTGFLAPPLANVLIEAYGWRSSYVILGALPLLLALPLAFLFFREAGGPGGSARRVHAGLTPAGALASWRFWLLGVCMFAVAVGVGGLIPNMVKLLTSEGYDRQTAAWAASLIGLFVILGRLLCGVLIDRYWAPMVAAVFLTLPAVSCLVLAQGGLGIAGVLVAVALLGLAAGAEFDLLAFFVARYFGLRKFGAIMGLVSIFFGLGAAVAPALFGRVFDRTGSYDPALVAAAALFAGGGLGLLLLGRYPRFEAPAPA